MHNPFFYKLHALPLSNPNSALHRKLLNLLPQTMIFHFTPHASTRPHSTPSSFLHACAPYQWRAQPTCPLFLLTMSRAPLLFYTFHDPHRNKDPHAPHFFFSATSTTPNSSSHNFRTHPLSNVSSHVWYSHLKLVPVIFPWTQALLNTVPPCISIRTTSQHPHQSNQVPTSAHSHPDFFWIFENRNRYNIEHTQLKLIYSASTTLLLHCSHHSNPDSNLSLPESWFENTPSPYKIRSSKPVHHRHRIAVLYTALSHASTQVRSSGLMHCHPNSLRCAIGGCV